MAAERTLESLANRLLALDQQIDNNRTPHISTEEALAFVESKKNPNTKSKTRSDIGKLTKWLREDGEVRQIEDIPPKELDIFFSRFLLSARKEKNNGEFEPVTLRGFKSSLSRYLISKDYQGDVNGKEFRLTRDVLKSKCVDLKEKGKGNVPNRAEPFTTDEVQILYQKNLLGDASPQSLINTLWLNNTMHFGLRGRQEHTSMLWGDVELNTTATGTEYLSFTERATKTRKGLTTDARQFTPKMFAQPDDIHCPVKLYKVYAEQRPESTKSPESRFYLCANPKFGKSCPSGNRWFLDIPIGKNSLGSIAKRMSEQANFSARHTNHSGRKTSITNLLDAGCPPTEVAQLSGHKNLMSLNSYHSVPINKQQSMSTIIHKHGAASSKESSVALNDIEMDDQSDEELMVASQEIEEALKSINNYEEISKNSSVINLPLVQSPGGHMKLSDPAYLFKGCTFHGNVTINMK